MPAEESAPDFDEARLRVQMEEQTESSFGVVLLPTRELADQARSDPWVPRIGISGQSQLAQACSSIGVSVRGAANPRGFITKKWSLFEGKLRLKQPTVILMGPRSCDEFQ